MHLRPRGCRYISHNVRLHTARGTFCTPCIPHNKAHRRRVGGRRGVAHQTEPINHNVCRTRIPRSDGVGIIRRFVSRGPEHRSAAIIGRVRPPQQPGSRRGPRHLYATPPGTRDRNNHGGNWFHTRRGWGLMLIYALVLIFEKKKERTKETYLGFIPVESLHQLSIIHSTYATLRLVLATPFSVISPFQGYFSPPPALRQDGANRRTT
jgi:hypothetical protein